MHEIALERNRQIDAMIDARRLRLIVITLFLVAVATALVSAQVPYPPPPLAPPPAQPGQMAPDPQQPLEYAFRPDLTNPQFGECLNLEKNWKMLWQRYAQEYQRARMMSPQDPQYAQMSYYLRGLKAQLDAAWQNFSSNCVYFPRRR
jgi:hypothetical protein